MPEGFGEFVRAFEFPIEWMWEGALVAVSLVAAGHVLLHKRDARPAAMWFAVCLLVPGVGALVYWMFGYNRIWTRAARLREGWPASQRRQELTATTDDPAIPARFGEVSNIGRRITGRPLLGGHELTLLRNGEEAYPPMLDAIRSATTSVWLSTYIFDRDEVGFEFAKALGDAVARGVDVRVLVDGLGEWYSPRRIGGVLREHGVPMQRFLAPSILPPSLHINLRYHRKLLVVDGWRAFTGGMNIGLRHMVDGRSLRKGVRDLQFEIRGPVVADMEAQFREDWNFASGEDSWPELPEATRAGGKVGDAHVRAVSAGPNEDLENLRWILLGALSQAERSVRIMTPYFIAESSLVAALNAAVLRGVQVEMILPARNNLFYMTWAANAQLWQVLEFGVRVFEQTGAFSHTKLILIDEDYALIGSSNLDPRSLRLNFEFNLEVCGGSFPEALRRHYETALAESNEVTLDRLAARPLWMRLRDAFAALFSPYL